MGAIMRPFVDLYKTRGNGSTTIIPITQKGAGELCKPSMPAYGLA